jgi:hypothetical protein
MNLFLDGVVLRIDNGREELQSKSGVYGEVIQPIDSDREDTFISYNKSVLNFLVKESFYYCVYC